MEEPLNELEFISTDNSFNEKKIIKSSELSFNRSDIALLRRMIRKVVAENKAHFTDFQESLKLDNKYVTLTIGVPEINLENLLAGISKGAGEFESRRIQVSDVTEDYIDLESKTITKKDLEKRYLSLLSKAR